MNKFSKRHLWEWFTRNNQEYLTLKNKPKKEALYWLNELQAHLRTYFKFLDFTLEWGPKGPAILTITVHGKAKHFKKATDLVAKAPAIPGWTIVALEEPRPLEFMLEEQIMDTGIDPRELSFSFDSEHPNASLIVYHPLCTQKNEHLIHQLAYAAVYNLLGERSFGDDICSLEVSNLSSADPDDVEELEALPRCLGMRKSDVMMVDNAGILIAVN